MEDSLQRIISDIADSIGSELRACCSLPVARMAEEGLSDKNFDLENSPYLTRIYDYTDDSGQEYAIYQVLESS